jgi:hypothetical protein
MNKFKHYLMAGALAAASTTASAGIIDFVTLIEDPVNGLGESAWTTLNVTDPSSGINMALDAGYYDSTGDVQDAYVYLDWGNAGVGVCRALGGSKTVDTAYTGDGSNLCDPGSDDNVTGGNDWAEFLDITFDQSASIIFTLNNNHDGGFDVADYALFDGVSVSASGNFINYEMNVSAGQTVRVMFGNEQFYLDTISVPEPAMFSLLGLGLLGFGFARRARKA